jgi:hypothetical protein
MEASGRVYFNFRQKCFRGGGKALKGAQALLERHLWPHYRLPRGADGRQERSNSIRGSQRGARVHKEINAYARAALKGLPLPASFRNNRIHKLTRIFFRWMLQSNATILDSELAVGCASIGVATAIDLVVCIGGNNIAIEIKTGMRNAWTQAQGDIRGPLSLPNCPLVHAAVQVGAGLFLMELSHPALRIHKAGVLHLSDDGAHLVLYEQGAAKSMGFWAIQYAMKCEKALQQERAQPPSISAPRRVQ